jgi:hypothetical protein
MPLVLNLGGREIPWYADAPIGAINYTKQERPAVISQQDIQNYIEYERNLDAKMREGSGGLGGFLTKYVNPVLDTAAADPLKTAAIFAATASGNAYLVPYIVGADTAIAGGSPEDVLKAAATAYITQGVGSEISSALGGVEGIGLPSETPYIDLPDGEFLLTPDVSSVPSLLSEGGLTSAEIDQLTNLAPETGSEISAYTTPIDTPAIGQPYDASPLIDPTEYGGTGQPFGSIEEPLVDNYMDGFTSTSETGLATLPEEGMQPDLPGTTILGDLGLAGAVETPIPSSGISISQALRGLNLAKGLLGGGQEGAAAPATQFKGARLPSGEVDYSGILNLLQMRSPQRRSLLG